MAKPTDYQCTFSNTFLSLQINSRVENFTLIMVVFLVSYESKISQISKSTPRKNIQVE